MFLNIAAASPAAFAASAFTVEDGGAVYNASASAYLIPDPLQKLSVEQVVRNFQAGRKGTLNDRSLISLGVSGVPQWIVIPVLNSSWTENWILNFGQHLDGRIGMLKDIAIYEGYSGTRYVDPAGAARNPYVQTTRMEGTAVKISMPRGRYSLFVVYAVPKAGHAVTLVPQFVSEQSYLTHVESPYRADLLLYRFFLIAAGLFTGAFLYGGVRGAWLFAMYYGCQFMQLQYHNAILYSDMDIGDQIPELLFSLGVLSALLGSKSFLSISAYNRAQDRMLLGFIVGILIAAGGSIFVLPSDSGMRVIGLLLPSMGGIAFLTLLSFAQAYNGQYGARLLATGWTVLLAGMLCTVMSSAGILNNIYTVAAYWYALVIQGILLMAAVTVKFFMMRRDELLSRAEQDENSGDLSRLRQSRETAEIGRLKKLIEHEREVMNKLREREVVQNEEMRKSKDTADEANRAKSAFLAVISHEIRTPMTGVMGMVRLLLDSKLNREQADYAQTIQDSGDAMLALLNDILDFEKIESGKMEIEHIDFDLHRIVNGIVTLMSGHAAAKGIALKIDLDSSVPRYVIGDPIRLRQVLLNLSGNSIKFTQKGAVTLRVKPDPTAENRGGMHRIRFAVEDTGIGISKEAQKNLFNPFAQVDKSISRKFGGTGLGLAISQRLIEAMGGRIHIDSTEGHGSTFFFTLIVEAGREEVAESQARLGSVLAPVKTENALRILIVEDNEINQKLLNEFVGRMGHETVLCGSGEDALKLMEKDDFDLVLMDVELPGMTGMGTTKAIRALKDHYKASVPVVALTGNSRDEDIGLCYAANMNGHLAKPVDPKRLKAMIDRVAEGRLDNAVELPGGASAPASRARAGRNAERPAPAAVSSGAVPAKPAPVELKSDAEDTDGGDFAPIHAFTQDYKPSAPEERAPPPPFDSSTLASLKAAMGRDELGILVDGLLAKMNEITGALATLAMPGDRDDIVASAHDLKGMAGNYGLLELSRLSETVERSARNGGAEAGDILSRIPAAAARAESALKAWLAG